MPAIAFPGECGSRRLRRFLGVGFLAIFSFCGVLAVCFSMQGSGKRKIAGNGDLLASILNRRLRCNHDGVTFYKGAQKMESPPPPPPPPKNVLPAPLKLSFIPDLNDVGLTLSCGICY